MYNYKGNELIKYDIPISISNLIYVFVVGDGVHEGTKRGNSEVVTEVSVDEQ